MENNNTKGILYILLGMALFSIQDALIKFVYNETALYELYFGRTLTAAILLVGYLLFSKQKIILKTHYPFFMSILAMIFLKEHIGVRRWTAIFVGFIGVYIVLNPNFENFNIISLAPVGCALCYSTSMTITKITSERDNVFTQMLHLYIGAMAISILFFIFTGKGQFNTFTDPTFQFIFREWFTNPIDAWPIIFTMGVVATFSFYFVFSAYSIASPSIVSLFEYSLIIWSIIIGYYLFNDIPSIRTFVGVILIITAGIYIYIREKTKEQYIVTENPIR